ncbi:MAG TPA: prepilin-type N-terminal cleavage/methylation domain-containing protein [Verrucomicrobiae bacterium]
MKMPKKMTGDLAGFTMVEIAICLAIIGVALVGIIGVLPIGLNTQRDTREETIINQDVATLLPIITQGSRGADDLTNYVFAITNAQTTYDNNGVPVTVVTNWYTISDFLTNGANIVGILSTPEYVTNFGNSYRTLPNVAFGGISNHIVAYVRSLSGLAAEKPPQNNDILVGNSFSYRIIVVNAPVAMDTNVVNTPFNKQLWFNQRELRLTYQWPLLPNARVGAFSQTFRATVAGQLSPTTTFINNRPLYFYQPQTFGVNTN